MWAKRAWGKEFIDPESNEFKALQNDLDQIDIDKIKFMMERATLPADKDELRKIGAILNRVKFAINGNR
jgi:hypothetical protein